MHLLNITNFDYIGMTLLFAVMAIIAYSWRRKQASSAVYLLGHGVKAHFGVWGLTLGNLGILEFTAVAAVGALWGYAPLMWLVPLYLVLSLIFDYTARTKGLNQLICPTVIPMRERFVLIFTSFIMLLVAAAALMVVVTVLKSLIGWEYGNTALSIVALIGILMLIGGFAGVIYIQAVAAAVFVIIGLGAVVLAYLQLPGGLMANLTQVAVANHLPPTIFTNAFAAKLTWQQLWLAVVGIITILVINPWYGLKFSQLNLSSKLVTVKARLWQIVGLGLMLSLGVLCLATPAQQITISGKKVITEQTRLSDGGVGFVVRAVPADGTQAASLGLVPRQASDSLTEDSSLLSYDYFSAGIVMVEHISGLAFIPLYLLIVLAMRTISENVGFATALAIRGIYVPHYNKTGEELENLWAARVFMFTFLVIVISLGLVFYKFFTIPYILGIIALLAIPLTLKQLGIRSYVWFDLLTYGLILLSLAVVKVSDLPSLLPLISFTSVTAWLSQLTLALTVWYSCGAVIKLIVTKVRGNESGQAEKK
jgi:hypothetical protein